MDGITVYTDGGCSGNPGPGAWAYVVTLDDQLVEGSAAVRGTTNNQMELTAVIQALEVVRAKPGLRGRAVHLHTDSMYVKNGITDWIRRWKRNGWLNSARKPVKNRELWERLSMLAGDLPVEWHWVNGHSGVPLNERCHAMVQRRILELRG